MSIPTWFGFPNDDVADDLQVFVEIPTIPLPNGRLVLRCLVGRGQLGLFVRLHIRLLVRLHVRFRVIRRGNGWGRRRASFTRGLGFGFPFGQLDVSRREPWANDPVKRTIRKQRVNSSI